MSKITKGSRVCVYGAPLTLEKFEGRALVESVIRREPWADIAGNPIVRCKVRFEGEEDSFERDVSILTVYQGVAQKDCGK